jgi:hypothetical protein
MFIKIHPAGTELFYADAHADGRIDKQADRHDKANSRFLQVCKRDQKVWLFQQYAPLRPQNFEFWVRYLIVLRVVLISHFISRIYRPLIRFFLCWLCNRPFDLLNLPVNSSSSSFSTTTLSISYCYCCPCCRHWLFFTQLLHWLIYNYTFFSKSLQFFLFNNDYRKFLHEMFVFFGSYWRSLFPDVEFSLSFPDCNIWDSLCGVAGESSLLESNAISLGEYFSLF